MDKTQLQDKTKLTSPNQEPAFENNLSDTETPSLSGVTNIPVYANVINVKSTENNISINFDLAENPAQSATVSAITNLVISRQTAYQLLQQLQQVLLNSQVPKPDNQELIEWFKAWADSGDLEEQKESWECIKHLMYH